MFSAGSLIKVNYFQKEHPSVSAIQQKTLPHFLSALLHFLLYVIIPLHRLTATCFLSKPETEAFHFQLLRFFPFFVRKTIRYDTLYQSGTHCIRVGFLIQTNFCNGRRWIKQIMSTYWYSISVLCSLLFVVVAQTDSVSGYAIKMVTAVKENEVKVSAECGSAFLKYSDGLGKGEHWALKSKHLFKLW